jgi:Protein of unknown function (DUF1186).
MNKKQEVLIEMLRKDNFEYMNYEGEIFYDLESALKTYSDNLVDMFYFGMENSELYISESDDIFILSTYLESKSFEEVIEEIEDVDEFLKYYLDKYSEDELYMQYVSELI